MQRGKFSFPGTSGRRLLSAAVVCALLVGSLAGSAQAQRFVDPVPSPKFPTPLPGSMTGTGGGAGLTLPNPAPTYAAPPAAVMPVPAAPLPAAPLPAAPAPAVPVPLVQPVPAAPAPAPPTQVRFRCDLAPEEQSCQEAGAREDGGDSDSECNCARDFCHDEAGPDPGQTHRVCDKLQ